jgi:hypothetical protein
MQKTLSLFFIYTVLTTLQAADLNPPAWRGAPGTTFQQWDFQFVEDAGEKTTITECSMVDFIETTQGGQATPDVLMNPYEQSTGICVEFKSLWFITKRLDWLQNYMGQAGVWKLQSHRTFENFLNFIIPNAAIEQNTTTIIQLQFLHHSERNSPLVKVLFPSGNQQPDTYLEVFKKHPDAILPQDWAHSTYTFKAAGCPRFESIFIYAPDRGDIYLDSVTIDTICTETPDKYLSP